MQAVPPVLMRRRSSALEAERAAVERQVEKDHCASLERRRSSYLPPATTRSDSNVQLRDAKKAIQTICNIHTHYEQRRMIENAAFVLAMSGIVMVLIDNEYTESELSKLCLRVANCVVSLLLLALVVWRFVLQRQILIARNVVPPHVALYRMPMQLVQLLAELLICAIVVPPGVRGSFCVYEWKFYVDDNAAAVCPSAFTVDRGSCYLVYSYPYVSKRSVVCDEYRVSYEVLGLFSLLRLYMLPRIVRNLSDFTNYRTSYLGVVHHVDTFSSLFAVKCFLRSHPFKFLLAAFAMTLVLTAYALAIVEAPVNPHLAPLWNAMWLVVLTMGTIGYGDLGAVTVAGQVLLVLGGMLAGILLVGVLSAAIFSFVSLAERDRRFVFLLRRQEHERRLEHVCAQSIQAAWRRSDAAARGSKRLSKLTDEMFVRVAEQRALRKSAIGDYSSAALELHDVREQLLHALRADHAASMKRLAAVESRLDAMLVAAGCAM